MMEQRRRLIEVAFPLEEVSAHSRREKNVRHGHISTLHIWWARRPLAACRAFIYASLVDDPESDQERDELLREVADLASWDAVRKPEQVLRARSQGGSGRTGAELLARARRRILDCNGGVPPRLLDPFAGGGAIPLEALRLGCEVEASDLNPVAVLILKGTVEYPQRFGQPDSRPVPGYILEAARARSGGQKSFVDGDPSTPLRAGLVEAYRRNPLATDVRYWGNWMLERARTELAEFYPPDSSDGSIPVAYLWSRTVPCPNCGAEMPLIRQYWLAHKDKKKVALKPMLDHTNKHVDFEVVEGANVTGDPAEATTSRGDTVCLLCRQVVKAEFIRQAGRDGKMAAALTSVVLGAKGKGGKRYRPDERHDLVAYEAAAERLRVLEAEDLGDLPLVPDEPIVPETLGLRIDSFGLDSWGKLFSPRQLLALVTFARGIGEVHLQMIRAGLDEDYAKAIVTYLGLALDRLADYNSTLSRWGNDDEGITNTFARQALSMVWDYGEANPIGTAGGSWESLLSGQVDAIASVGCSQSMVVPMRPARPSLAGEQGISQVLREVLPCMLGVFDSAGSQPISRYRWTRCCLPPVPRTSAPQTSALSELNTRPARTPVNASPPTSRSTAHDSGNKVVRYSFLVRDFHSLHLASLSWRFRGQAPALPETMGLT